MRIKNQDLFYAFYVGIVTFRPVDCNSFIEILLTLYRLFCEGVSDKINSSEPPKWVTISENHIRATDLAQVQ